MLLLDTKYGTGLRTPFHAVGARGDRSLFVRLTLNFKSLNRFVPATLQNHHGGVIGVVACHLSSFWNAVDLSVVGISASYFILKFTQIENEHLCWALGTTPRDTLSLNCILLSFRILHTLLVEPEFGPIMSALILIMSKVCDWRAYTSKPLRTPTRE